LAGLFFGLSRDLSRLGGFLLPGFHEDSLRKSGRNVFLETILLDPMPQFTPESIQWTSGKNAQYFTIDLGAQPGFSTVGSMIRLFGCGSQGTSEQVWTKLRCDSSGSDSRDKLHGLSGLLHRLLTMKLSQ